MPEDPIILPPTRCAVLREHMVLPEWSNTSVRICSEWYESIRICRCTKLRIPHVRPKSHTLCVLSVQRFWILMFDFADADTAYGASRRWLWCYDSDVADGAAMLLRAVRYLHAPCCYQLGEDATAPLSTAMKPGTVAPYASAVRILHTRRLTPFTMTVLHNIVQPALQLGSDPLTLSAPYATSGTDLAYRATRSLHDVQH
eukprot:3941523-Rhodomonas_salina.2